MSFGPVFSDQFQNHRRHGLARPVNSVKRLKYLLGIFFIRILPVVHAHEFLFGVPVDSARCRVEKGEVARQVNFVVTLFDAFKNVTIFSSL